MNISQIPNPISQPARKPYDIRERSFQFALQMLQVASRLPDTTEGRIVRSQLSKAGTSVGANVEEAGGAETRPDKRRSFTVARKEARESNFWLRIVHHRWKDDIDVAADFRESTELMKILSAIIKGLA
jgi:four helix bundle protein